VNFVIYDLEATCWEGKPALMKQEIIEIGAYLLNPYGEVEDVFSTFVQPVVHPYLSFYCQKLTSIAQKDVTRAPRFPEASEMFLDWAESFDEDFVLCSWGSFDRKLLIENCDLHEMDSEWVDPHMNIKHQYQEIRRHRHPIGLKSAVELEGFEFTGTHHRALSDAENLAKIFGKYLDVWQY
jgi:inhibitor of KinA sporulation pathway (predicted exonuclease)